MAAHVADCSPRVPKFLKNEWEVGAVSPGVADHITLGIPEYASGILDHTIVPTDSLH